MEIENAICENFKQLQWVLENISAGEYVQKSEVLNNASIGQHYRHLLEMFICLTEGYENGVVNYDDRKRDKELEEDKHAAAKCMNELLSKIGMAQKPMVLIAAYDDNSVKSEELKTSYHRELAYALEHSVHHMAIIRIGLKTIGPDLLLPENFGVAASTLKYRKVCAQ